MTENNQTKFDISALPVSKETGDALVKPVAASIGNAGGTVLDGLFHLILDPVRKFNIQRQHALEEFEKNIRESVSEIPEEYLDHSKTGIVLKTLEDARYQLNEESIRDMFSQLVSATMDSRTNSKITPKYSSIIADMSPKEAVLLERIYHNMYSVVPVVNLRIRDSVTLSERIFHLDMLLFDTGRDDTFPLELSLLESANLISLKEDFRLTSQHFEAIIDEYIGTFPPDLNNFFKGLLRNSNELISFQHSAYFLTELGRSFCSIVFE
ncbi:DUF4393 domain-containing protein [Streptococcus danieliae]|nr:DUF4393 domain-containing protein [Streptococcus danieliae]